MRNMTTMEIDNIKGFIETVMNDDSIGFYAKDVINALGDKVYDLACGNWIGDTKIYVAEKMADDVVCVATLDFFFERDMLRNLGFNYDTVGSVTVDENGIKVVLE